ncbi:regulator of chromosome condensation 1/beta-lactamase-inhibitor protein II [Tribonema minus]|uniref:Regulator of chromosome condensation 1/beta-lactamase-inhibitor protein II n=1 Tax=Tribonema minus TaxID=303371 RepID=A0A835YY51_9STRA|nr:regulator of chromosome condensation 1/beta-lactamase-inhibitor protein II [Tribonema minus]
MRLDDGLLEVYLVLFPLACSTGDSHACALLDDSTVKCWGSGYNGQLGQGSSGSSAADLSSPPRSAINLGSGRTAKAIATGVAHTCALLDVSTVKCWGSNDFGQLGQGTSGNSDSSTTDLSDADLSTPPRSAVNLGSSRTAKAIAAGAHHTCALLDDSTVKCWGSGYSGQLGQGESDSSAQLNSPPRRAINLGSGRTAKAIAAGDTHTCALLDDSTVKCWGEGEYGQLGQGNYVLLTSPASTAINLGPGRKAKAIAAGGHNTCVLLDDFTVKCWGEGKYGQLGQGRKTDLFLPPISAINLGPGRTAKAIATSGHHMCAILDDSTVKCWGEGDYGEFGLGNNAELSSPPIRVVDLGSGRTATAISAGYIFTCALLDDSTIKCLGHGARGQLGQGSTANVGDKPHEMASLPAIVL